MQRIWNSGLGVIPLAPVKNQIRGKENKRNFRRKFSQKLCDFHINMPGERGIFLRFANVRNRGAMNDKLWLVLLKFATDGGKIKQVKIRARQCAHSPAREKLRRGLDKIISNQSVRTGNPNKIHPYLKRKLVRSR